jgi:hypothetical protein
MAIDTSQATKNSTVDQERLQELWEGLAVPGKNNLNKPLITIGFTISNVAEKIDESLAEKDLLGWFLKFGERKNDTFSSFTQLSEIKLIKFYARGALGGTRVLDTQMVPQPGILPKLLWQVDNPGDDGRNEDFDTAISHTNLAFSNLADALTTDLTHHTPWAEAVFLRRSDLRFLRMYLRTFPNIYNDLLFTGAKVNYDVMHMPPMRRNQFSLPTTALDGGKVPDSSKAFTLKVEPLRDEAGDFEVPVTGDTSGGQLGPLEQPDAGNIGGDPSDNAGGNINEVPAPTGRPYPAAAIGIPCPDYWEILEEIEDQIQPASPVEFQAMLDTFQSQVEQNGIEGIAAGTTNISGITDGGFTRLLTWIIDRLTNLRDGLR